MEHNKIIIRIVKEEVKIIIIFMKYGITKSLFNNILSNSNNYNKMEKSKQHDIELKEMNYATTNHK